MTSGLGEEGQREPFTRSSLWIPEGVEYDGEGMAAYPRDLNPVNEKHIESKYTLKFPPQMGGLFMQTSSVMRPTNGNDYQQTFNFIVARWYDEYNGPQEPGYFTREELTAIRDHLSFVLEDSEK